nr:uncharacterized protein LOC111099438 isoform X2 [Crassostrea virginica]
MEKRCFDLKHNCGSLEYHCVINEWTTEMIEVCAPTKVIVGKVCAEYNSGGMMIQRNSNAKCKECPSVYSSPNSYLYPECYTYVRENRRSHNTTAFPQSSHSHSYSNLVTSKYLSSSVTLKPVKKDKNDTSGMASNTSKGPDGVVLAVGVPLLLLMLVAFGVICLWRKICEKPYFKVPVLEYLRREKTEKTEL